MTLSDFCDSFVAKMDMDPLPENSTIETHYSCNQCEAQFSTKQILNMHVKALHSIETNDGSLNNSNESSLLRSKSSLDIDNLIHVKHDNQTFHPVFEQTYQSKASHDSMYSDRGYNSPFVVINKPFNHSPSFQGTCLLNQSNYHPYSRQIQSVNSPFGFQTPGMYISRSNTPPFSNTVNLNQTLLSISNTSNNNNLNGTTFNTTSINSTSYNSPTFFPSPFSSPVQTSFTLPVQPSFNFQVLKSVAEYEYKKLQSINENYKYKCPYVGCEDLDYSTTSHLKRHIKECHEKVKAYQCGVEGCGKAFKRKEHLQKHLGGVHKMVMNEEMN